MLKIIWGAIMNNRFEQLWQQVNLQECDCGCNPDEFLRLRFAELIVRECVTTIETYNNNSLTKKIADEGVYSYEQGAIAGMNESVLVIKQHFGIEE